ncbi:MAG: DNA polymerase III subunit beta [Sandaracinaceae bacterium]|nr:DNA polymerase III subunit beta [Sandaracinaceae bacterium]
MEVSVSRQQLIKGIGRAHAIASRKSPVPILGHLRLSANPDGQLLFEATDLQVSVTSAAFGKVNVPGAVTVPAKFLFDVAKGLPDLDVLITSGPKQNVEIKAGKSRYRILGSSPEDFPQVPTPSGKNSKCAQVPCNILKKLIQMTYYSMSTDETRPHLSSALMQVQDNSIRMVTTDGHRLSKAQFSLDRGLDSFSALIPSRAVLELKRALDEKAIEDDESHHQNHDLVEIISESNFIFFKTQDLILSAKISAEIEFPPYERVIPKNQEKTIKINREAIASELKRLASSIGSTTGVKLRLEPGLLRIHGENPQTGEGTEEIDCDYSKTDILDIGFNPKYLIDAFNAVDSGDVIVEFSGELDPASIRIPETDEFIAVIMPMRI